MSVRAEQVRARPRATPLDDRPELRVVERRRSRRARLRRTRVLAVGAAVLFGAGLLALVASHVVLAQDQLRLDQVEARAAAAQSRYEQLRVEVAGLEAPQRIVTEARRIGMVQPDKVTWLTPPPDAVPPGAAAAPPGTDGGSETASGAVGTWGTVKPHLSGQP